MNRRTFLVESLGLLPLLVAPQLLSCKKSSVKGNGKTVAVIGSGISGLAAAKALKENGCSVIVLEARSSMGGRLSTNRSAAIPFDEGASWIHGITGNPLTALAQQAGMTTAETPDSNRKCYDVGGVARTAADYDLAENELYQILNTLKNSGNNTQSFETVFNSQYPSHTADRLWKFLLSTYVTFDTGDLNKLSSLLYDEGEEFSGPEVIAVNGYETLIAYLAKDIDVRLNQAVTSIDYAGQAVQIGTNTSHFVADYVLVTVPLGVLKAGSIQFTPALPSKKSTAISGVGMNCVNKFLLIWDTPFWDNVQYISYTPAAPDAYNYFVNLHRIHSGSAALLTFAYADAARQSETLTDQQVIQQIMANLKDIYGNTIPDPVRFLRTKWQSNPFSNGSYSYTSTTTQMSHFDDLAESINNKLFFAGEHTHADYFSTAHGAYLSGLREADKIVSLL